MDIFPSVCSVSYPFLDPSRKEPRRFRYNQSREREENVRSIGELFFHPFVAAAMLLLYLLSIHMRLAVGTYAPRVQESPDPIQ